MGQSFWPPRLANGHPDIARSLAGRTDFGGLRCSGARKGRQIPAGLSFIADPPDGKLPHLPEAAKKAKLNWDERDRDPVGYCHPHGAPRQLVPPFPLEIVEDGDYFAVLSETEHSVRVIPLDGRPHRKNYRAWVGDSRGHWDADTLVVDVIGLNGKTWLDPAGNFVDENEHVVERFTIIGPNTIVYEATVTDPTVYARPWTIRIPLARQPKGTELIEYDCDEGERDVTGEMGQRVFHADNDSGSSTVAID